MSVRTRSLTASERVRYRQFVREMRAGIRAGNAVEAAKTFQAFAAWILSLRYVRVDVSKVWGSVQRSRR